jgi:UDP-GlcNAc3NAcA epimerase
MKVVSVVGARPQFVKLMPVSRALRHRHREVIVHTGQHYDRAMSGTFLQELGIPAPDYNLGVGSDTHARQTGAMMAGIEDLLLVEKPDLVLVFGDTNSTLAAGLAAAKLHVAVAHVEAGLRSRNRSMPEEVNRVLTDHLATYLFCPTRTAVDNLAGEGIASGVHLVGDVMHDAILALSDWTHRHLDLLEKLEVPPGGYLLATVHRPSNTDDPGTLATLLRVFGELGEPVVFPVHPRTSVAIARWGLAMPPNVRATEPVSYLEMLCLEKHARKILTDSGGIQKEAYFFGVPCVTLRTETEWVELVEAGWNRVVGTDRSAIVEAVTSWQPAAARPPLFGDGNAAERIAAILEDGVR